MLPVEWSDQAEADLAETWHYIAMDSIVAAQRWLAQIRAAAHDLSVFPHSGREREELGPGIRSIVKQRYLILYRVHTHRVEIARVIHGARNLDEMPPL